MADVITNPSPPAGGSHRTTAVIVILTALILAALIWVSTQGRNNQISDRVGTTPPATGTASGVTSGGGTGSQAGTSPSDATQPGGNQSTDEGQPVTGH
jgi:hypothetical protein